MAYFIIGFLFVGTGVWLTMVPFGTVPGALVGAVGFFTILRGLARMIREAARPLAEHAFDGDE